jgi:hypothetical protein
MKRMAVVAAVLFAGSITLSSAALWAQDTGDQDTARPDTGEIGVDDGGRQLRESQHPEPGFGNDPLNQQRTPDSSYNNDDASINDEGSATLRKNKDDPDQDDPDADQKKQQDQDDQNNQGQIGARDPMEQPELNDPAERPDPAETDPAIDQANKGYQDPTQQADQGTQGNPDPGNYEDRFGLPGPGGRR